MKVEVKKTDTLKRQLKFEISKDRVSKKTEEVYGNMSKVASVKGFRKGKVPKNVLESQYSAQAQEEVLQQLIPETYQEALQQEKLFPIDMPEISDVAFKDGIITYIASLEIKPEVKIKDYKAIKVKRKSSEVSEEELNKTLDYFKTAQGKDKEVNIDDDFAKGLGYPSLEGFKGVVRRQMEMDKDRANKFDVENQIIEALHKKAKLATPESLVKRQMHKRLEEMKTNLKKQGMSEEDIKKKEEDMRKELKSAVEKDVRTYLILDKIAEEEKIEVKEGGNLPMKVMEFLLKEAEWQEDNDKK